jgi:tetratricopeptide (TPR) repeat protein
MSFKINPAKFANSLRSLRIPERQERYLIKALKNKGIINPQKPISFLSQITETDVLTSEAKAIDDVLKNASSGFRKRLFFFPQLSKVSVDPIQIVQTDLKVLEEKNIHAAVDSLVNEARDHFKRRDLDKAFDLLKAVLGMDARHTEALLLKADIVFQRKDFENGVFILKDVLVFDPNNHDARNKLAGARLSQARESFKARKRELALRYINETLELWPDHASALALKARVQLFERQYYECLVTLTKLKDVPSERENFKELLTRCCEDHLYKNRGTLSPDGALDFVERALSMIPGNEDILILKAKMLQAKRDFPAAEAVLSDIIRLNPRNVKAYYRMALLEKAKGDLSSAERFAKEGLAIEPFNTHLACFYASEMISRGEILSSFQMLCRIRTAKLEDQNTLELIAACLERLDRVSEAVEVYEEILSRWPREKRSIYSMKSLGLCLLKIGKPEEAIKYFKMAISLDPCDQIALMNLAVIYHDGSRLQDAAVRFEELLRLNISYGARIMTRKELSAIYEKLGDLSSACDQLFKLLDETPSTYPYFIAFANRLYRDYKREDMAEEMYMKALTVKRDDRSVFGYLINLFLKAKRFGQAEKCCNTALSLWPADIDLHYKKARMYLARKNYREALDWYDSVVMLICGSDPDLKVRFNVELYAWSRLRIGEILLDFNRPGEAIEVLTGLYFEVLSDEGIRIEIRGAIRRILTEYFQYNGEMFQLEALRAILERPAT